MWLSDDLAVSPSSLQQIISNELPSCTFSLYNCQLNSRNMEPVAFKAFDCYYIDKYRKGGDLDV